MSRVRPLLRIIALLAGAVPLATMGTCTRTETGGHVVITSSNDHLLADVLDFLGGGDDDDDD